MKLKTTKHLLLVPAVALALAVAPLGCDGNDKDDAVTTDEAAAQAENAVEQLVNKSEEAEEKVEDMKDQANSMADDVKSKVTDLVDQLKTAAEGAMDAASDEQKPLLTQVTEISDQLKAAVNGSNMAEARNLLGKLTAMKDNLPDSVSSVVDQITGALPTAEEAVNKVKGMLGGGE